MSDLVIDISGLDKGAVLAVLYNHARVQGFGVLRYKQEIMTPEVGAKTLREVGPYFDYLHGRVMKVEIGGDELDPRLYDRDNGQGAAAMAIDTIR